MEKKKIFAQKLVRDIRGILTYILMIAIYVLIWYFTYKRANDDITFWGIIICFVIGWAIMSWYEKKNYLFSMNKFYKLLGAIVGIPLLFGSWVNMLIDYLLKENEPKKETKTEDKVQKLDRARTAEEILEEVNKIEKKYNNISSYSNYDFNTEYEYECERCFKRISEEDYDLYDGMCEECFDETHYDFNGTPREDYWNY